MDPLTSRRLSAPLRTEELEHARWMRRLTCQLEFAEALARASGKGGDVLAEAHTRVNTGGPLPQLVQEVEQALAPLAADAKMFTIHLVGHGHIDMNWMWGWPETVATTHDTFASVLSLMRAYPEFTYSQSQASVYALIERHHPAMFAEIQERVREGRWEVTAAQWVEGDKNLVNGESLSRHYLYAREFFRSRFDLSPEDVPVQWEPDTFGHAATVPMLARSGAVKFYYACRTGGGFDHIRVGDERPPLFWWQSPDGSRILVNRETSWYNSYVNIGDNIAAHAVAFFEANGIRDWLNVYGIGNHGGGPTRKEIDYYLEMREWPIYPRLEFSTSRRFFEKVAASEEAKNLPVVNHELNFEFTGCYTSQSLIKQANRLGENGCLTAEAIATMAHLASGSAASVPDLREAWLPVLFNQFHDILPGSGVRQTREHACAGFQESTAIASSVLRNGMKAITDRIHTRSLLPQTPEGAAEQTLVAQGEFEAGAGLGSGLNGNSLGSSGGRNFRPYVFFNPCGWERTEAVTVALWDTDFRPESIVAWDAEGIAHPTFHVETVPDEWGHHRISVTLYVTVPALGYAAFVFGEGTPTAQPALAQVVAGEKVRTDQLDVEFHRYRSGIGVTNRTTGEVIADGDLGLWRTQNEVPRMMTSWVLGDDDGTQETAVARSFDLGGEDRNVATLAASGRNLFLTGTHRLNLGGNSSEATVRALVHSARPQVDFQASLKWHEIGSETAGIPGVSISFFHRLGWRPIGCEIPFGHIERTAEEEVPSLRYVHVPHEKGGFTILNDGKSSFHAHPGGVEMRVIRSSFDPDPLPEVNHQSFRYSVVFHDAPPSVAELMRLGIAFNQPIVVAATDFHAGDLPARAGYLEGASDDIVISSIKPAEDGKGCIVRLVNPGDSTAAIGVRICGRAATGAVDAMERDVDGDGTIAPYGTVALRFPAKT